MKKALLLAPLLMVSCNEKEAAQNAGGGDSIVLYDRLEAGASDSSGNGVTVRGEAAFPEISNTFRATEGNKIIKTVNGDMIPFTVQDEFLKDDQQFILKIRNFKGSAVTGRIVPDNPDMNIRFNQIRLANDKYDGPFGREINYDIKQKGEIWLIVGRSNMASGASAGKFEIQIR